MSCPEGQYFCNDRQKCMPIPKGKKVRKDGELVSEVAPPGWGHTKAEKEKTKPDKPKSKIGGSAAAFKRALDDGRFKGLPGDKTKKEKTASMFKLMWAMKKKGAKPHYKPGTDKKYKKYQEESVQNGKVDLTLKTDVNNVLKQDNKEYDRGLLAQVNKDGSYDVAYWYDKYKAYPVEVEVDGKSIKKDAKNIHIKYHPELKKESFEIDKSAHKTAQKKAKMRNLARGNENPNEKAAAEKKAGGPKLMGEGKKWDSYKKAVATVLGKKKEKKAEKATDAGARAKRKLQRKVHAKYVSGSEDLVPDDMRD